MRKPGRKAVKKPEKSSEKVDHVIEATLLTEKIDVTCLNQLAYAAAITMIKTTYTKNKCIIKKWIINRKKEDWTFNMNRWMKDLQAGISKISQMNDPRPSPKIKRNMNRMKTKYWIINDQTRFTSLKTLNVYVPLAIDSPDIKRGKSNASKTYNFIKSWNFLMNYRVTKLPSWIHQPKKT